MPEASSDERWLEGRRALEEGRWEAACLVFDEVHASAEAGSARQAESLEALLEAHWWLGHVGQSLDTGMQAYEAWRRLGDNLEAARVALWLAGEYGRTGSQAVAAGWLARAETVGGQVEEVRGWVALTRAVLATVPEIQEAEARTALTIARRSVDGDLEALALGRLGLALITRGRFDEGLGCFDEAMAACAGGDSDRNTLALLCCDLALATELSGEAERFAQWSSVVLKTTEDSAHPDLLAFCATCCAEVFSIMGDWKGAEFQLRQALDALGESGHRARCIAPAAKLAELLVLQGRAEEAAVILDQESSDAGLLVRARIALHRGDSKLAISLAERHRRRVGGDTLLAVPALALQVDALLALDDKDGAAAVVERLVVLAQVVGNRRAGGRAQLARARVLAARGSNVESIAAFEAALDLLDAVAPQAIETSETHLDLARMLTVEAPDLARVEAKAALTGFEAAGATHGADAAAALLRSLGDRSRVGVKGTGVLTDREREVLRLLTQGLTNAEIADRLYISTKTAGNHVSSILTKLGMRSRVEAAAFAALHPGD